MNGQASASDEVSESGRPDGPGGTGKYLQFHEVSQGCSRLQTGSDPAGFEGLTP